MIIAIVLMAVSIVLFFSLRFLVNDTKRNYNTMDENIKSIESKMSELHTVEDCVLLQKEISKYHNNTDQLLKGIRFEYKKRYYMVHGIRYAIENKIVL